MRSDGFTLDQGTVDGVEVNDAVISDEGYLLGVVVEADSHQLQGDDHPAPQLQRGGRRVPARGTTASSPAAPTTPADGLCVLTNLNRNTVTQKSDQVITTGLGGVFPPDVLVGVVQEVVPEVSGKSSIAVITPGADPRTVQATHSSLPII